MANLEELTDEKIVANVEASLKLIRKSGGYWNDIDEDSVTREFRTPEQITSAEMPYLQVIDGDTRRVTEESFFPKKPLAMIEVIIDGLIRETDPLLRPVAVNRCVKDIMRCLYADPTRDGAALVTHIASVERFDAALGYDDLGAFRITVEVFYRYLWTNP